MQDKEGNTLNKPIDAFNHFQLFICVCSGCWPHWLYSLQVNQPTEGESIQVHGDTLSVLNVRIRENGNKEPLWSDNDC